MSTSEKEGHSGFVDAFPSQYGSSIIGDAFSNDAHVINPRSTSAPPTLHQQNAGGGGTNVDGGLSGLNLTGFSLNDEEIRRKRRMNPRVPPPSSWDTAAFQARQQQPSGGDAWSNPPGLQNKSFLESMRQNYPPESQVGNGMSFDGHQQQIPPQMYGSSSGAGGINDVGSLGGFEAPNLGGFQYGGYGAGISGINGGMRGYGQSNQGMLPFGNNMNPMMGTPSSHGTNAFNMGGFMNHALPNPPLHQGQQYSVQMPNAPDGRNGHHHAPRRQPQQPAVQQQKPKHPTPNAWGKGSNVKQVISQPPRGSVQHANIASTANNGRGQRGGRGGGRQSGVGGGSQRGRGNGGRDHAGARHVGDERSAGNGPRSAVLDEFRDKSNNQSKMTIAAMKGHVMAFAQDQHGSRFIQQKLEFATDDEKQLIFHEISNDLIMLMNDVFGNYVIQKLFDFGLPQHKVLLVNSLRGNVLKLALQMYGCRVVQKAIETVDDSVRSELVDELRGHVEECVRDQNGNHVIQKCIEHVPPNKVDFIIGSFYGKVLVLAKHPYGCRVVQRVLEFCTMPQKSPVLDEILTGCKELILDQYGNYVIQHILTRGITTNRDFVIRTVEENVLEFSRHKFASNVVEKALQSSTAKNREKLILAVLEPAANGCCPLQTMMKDAYANYVVQKVLDFAQGKQFDRVVQTIQSQAAQLKRLSCGKHILNRLEEKLNGMEKKL
jgi:hypothetical protein